MKKITESKFPAAVPEIPVSNIDEAAEYYKMQFGFNVDWVAGDIGLAGISRGDCRMFLADAGYRKHNGNKSPIVIWLNMESIDEVDELYESWRGSRAKLLSGPESKPWYLHEFTAEDLDGNLFRVFHDFGPPESGE